MLGPTFDLQGHRGARGLRPENTLPSFETAFDLGVSAVETDLHLTADGVPVLFHDHRITDRLFRPCRGSDRRLAKRPPIGALSLAELRAFRADRNPYPEVYPDQDPGVTPLAAAFARERGIDPHTPPALEELFAFTEAYAGPPGQRVGKGAAQRARARAVRFDLELKRIPFRRAIVGDTFDGRGPGALETRVVDTARRAGVLDRVIIRSFDHRAVAAVRRLEPGLTTAVLVAGTAPVKPAELARQAGARVYCPHVEFLDRVQVEQLHAAGIRVVPWTVNHAEDWQRLLDWGVDGITTDFPDRLARLLSQRDVPF